MKKLSLSLVICLLIGMLPCIAIAEYDLSGKTPLSGSTRARLENIRLAAEAIDGTMLDYGDEFSFNELVGQRTKGNGFQSAINGRGVKVTGGGVAQVASTLYLALKPLGQMIHYTEKSTYGSRYNGKYVDSSQDAILVDNEDADFRFINEYSPFTISIWIEDNSLFCELQLSSAGNAIGQSRILIDGSDAVIHNVNLAADSIYETSLYNGDMFSFNELVGPRTEQYGYESARNGRGVKVTGGGVAQVASCIWLAIKNLDCVEINEKRTYGNAYTQSYVNKPADAILTDYGANLDFSFTYVGEGMLSIYTEVDDGEIFCDIYEQID